MQGVWMINMMLIPFLGWNTVTDLRKRKISLLSVLLFATGGIAMLIPMQTREWILLKGESVWNTVFGILAGVFLYLLAVATKGAIGKGDALVCSVMGFYLGIYRLLFLLMMSFLLCGFFGAVLLWMKKAGRKSRLPLIPFVMAAYLGLLMLEWFLQ